MKRKTIAVVSLGLTSLVGTYLSLRYISTEIEKCFNERRSTID